jgi:hypothetical protein
MATQAKIVLTAEDRASRVIGQVRAEMGRAGESATQLAGAAGLISPAFAALAGAAGLVAFVKNVVDAADALNDVADATGASVEALSGLERVARLNGGTLDDVAGTLVKFNAALNAAGDPKSDAAAVFTALGLSAKELQAADPAEALQRAAIALQGFANDGNKARIIQELFGKSIREAAPFLKDLAEAGKLQTTTTQEQAEAAEKFNKVLFALRVAAEDAGKSLTFGMGAALEKTIENWKAATAAFGGFAGALQAVLSGATQLKDDPAKGLRQYNDQLAVLDARIKAVRDGSDGFLGRFADLRVKDLQAERAEVAKVTDYYRTLVNAGSAGAGRGAGELKLPALAGLGKTKSVTPPREEINQAATALAAYVDQLEKEQQKTQELSLEQEALNKLRSLGVLGQVPQVRELVLGLAKQIQLSQDQAEIEKGVTAELGQQAKLRQGLDEALDRFSGEVFSTEELDRIVKGIGGIKDEAEKTFDGADKALDRFVENVQDALGSTVEATLRGDFQSIGRLWGDLLIKMASQAIAADIGRALFGDIGKASGSGASTGVLSGLLGTLFGGGLTGARASGGPVSAGGTYLVGERGPELLQMGSSAGAVIPNSALQPGRASVAISMPVSISIDARTDQAQIAQLVGGAMAQTQRDMWAQLHARGLA